MTDAALDTPLPARSRGAVALVLLALGMGGFAIGVTEFAVLAKVVRDDRIGGKRRTQQFGEQRFGMVESSGGKAHRIGLS